MSQVHLEVNSKDLHDTIATLNGLPKGIRNRAIRIGLNKAGGMVRDYLTSSGLVPEETGTLRKSFVVKVKQTKKTGDWAMTVGASRKKKRIRIKLKSGKRSKSKKKHRTAGNYVHLVNNGTSRGVKGKFFMQAGLASLGSPAIEIVRQRILAEIQTKGK